MVKRLRETRVVRQKHTDFDKRSRISSKVRKIHEFHQKVAKNSHFIKSWILSKDHKKQSICGKDLENRRELFQKIANFLKILTKRGQEIGKNTRILSKDCEEITLFVKIPPKDRKFHQKIANKT